MAEWDREGAAKGTTGQHVVEAVLVSPPDCPRRVLSVGDLAEAGVFVRSIGEYGEYKFLAVRIAVMDVSAGRSPSRYGRFVLNGAHLKPAAAQLG